MSLERRLRELERTWGPPGAPVDARTPEERVADARERLPQVVRVWRHGTHRERVRAGRLLRRLGGAGDPGEVRARYPALGAFREDLGRLLTEEERADLGVD